MIQKCMYCVTSNNFCILFIVVNEKVEKTNFSTKIFGFKNAFGSIKIEKVHKDSIGILFRYLPPGFRKKVLLDI